MTQYANIESYMLTWLDSASTLNVNLGRPSSFQFISLLNKKKILHKAKKRKEKKGMDEKYKKCDENKHDRSNMYFPFNQSYSPTL